MKYVSRKQVLRCVQHDQIKWKPGPAYNDSRPLIPDSRPLTTCSQSSRKCLPVKCTNTSSKLACRVVR